MASCVCEEDVQPRVGDGLLVVIPGTIIEIKSCCFQPLIQPRILVRAWHMRLDDDEKAEAMIAKMKAVGWIVTKESDVATGL